MSILNKKINIWASFSRRGKEFKIGGIIKKYLIKQIIMQRFKTFIIFLVLLAIWSMFFSLFKFFIWWDLSSTLKPDLQMISWYLSLWWAISYVIWWALAYSFIKRYFLFFISIFTLIIVFMWNFIWFESELFFAISVVLTWVLYGLWTVVKNILISIEISKTGLQDTTVNALAWIVFVVFVILWSIFWSLISENLGHNWFYVMIWMLTLTGVLSLWLDYEKITIKWLLKNGLKSYYFDRKHKISDSAKEYLPELKYIFKKYNIVLISIWLLWSISTIVSQKAIDYSVINFDKLPSEAWFLLLYSAVWAILWNVISMKMEKNRWKYFTIFNTLFAILILVFPFIATFWYTALSVWAFVIGIFFGWASNLIDAYYLRSMWDENKKEFWSSTYGLVLSIIIFILMFSSSYIDKQFWFTVLMIALSLLIFVVSYLNYNKK